MSLFGLVLNCINSVFFPMATNLSPLSVVVVKYLFLYFMNEILCCTFWENQGDAIETLTLKAAVFSTSFRRRFFL